MNIISINRHIGKEVIFLTNMIKRLLPGRVEQQLGSHDLTGMQGMFLGYIADHVDSGDVFQRDLEVNFNIRRSTATGILQLMERDGLIIRHPVSHDARLKKIVLMQKARDIDNYIRNEIDQIEKKLAEGLTDEELETFFKVIDKVKKNAL